MPWRPMRWLVPAVVLASLMLGGCAVQSAAPGSSAPAAGGSVDGSSAAAAPTAARATSSTDDRQAAPAISPAEGPASRISVVAAGSAARYRAHEQFVGQSLPNEAVGSTSDVSGAIVLDGNSALDSQQSKIVVDLRTLRSDESRRDQYIQANTLETAQFPYAEFVPREVRGSPATLPTSGEATFQLLGDLTVHGVTQPVVWDVTAQFSGADVSGLATTHVNMTDFGMKKPQVARLLSIDDGLTLELQFQGLVAPEPAAAGVAAPASSPT